LTGGLTLDGGGTSNPVFIFKIGSTLTTASNSNVRLINGTMPCNVFWQVGSSATLGTTTSFIGNILVLTSITVTTGASINGRALAQNGAMTLDSNNVFSLGCTATPTTCKDITPPTVTATAHPPTGRAHAYIELTVHDVGCAGLASIAITGQINVDVNLPAFTPGTTSVVTVIATKLYAGQVQIGIRVTDVNANVTQYDPTLLELTRTRGKPEPVTLTGVPREEHFITVVNSNPGLDQLRTDVNGTPLRGWALEGRANSNRQHRPGAEAIHRRLRIRRPTRR
jgi:Ice-binding-like